MNTLWKKYKLKVLYNITNTKEETQASEIIMFLKIASYFIMLKSAANVQLLPNCLQ